MKQEELTKTFMMILNLKNPLVAMVYKKENSVVRVLHDIIFVSVCQNVIVYIDMSECALLSTDFQMF